MTTAQRAAKEELGALVSENQVGVPRIVTIMGAAGVGRTTVAFAVASELTDRQVLWFAMLPPDSYGHGKVAYWEVADGSNRPPQRIVSIAEVLDLIGEQSRAFVVMDDVHFADSQDEGVLVRALLDLHDRDLVVAFSVRSAHRSDAVGIARAGMGWHEVIEVPASDDAEILALCGGEDLDDTLAPQVLAFCAGSPGRATYVASAGGCRSNDVLTQEGLERILVHAVGPALGGTLMHAGPDPAAVALLAVLIAPHGGIAEATETLGVSRRHGSCAERFISDLRISLDVSCADVVLRGLVDWLPREVVDRVCAPAIAFLKRSSVPTAEVFRVAGFLGASQEQLVALARRATRQAIEQGSPREALDVAAKVLPSARPADVPWARGAVLEAALECDWQVAASTLATICRDDGSTPELPDVVLPPEIFLEAPDQMRGIRSPLGTASRCGVDDRRSHSGATPETIEVEARSLLTRAITGEAVEDDIERFDERFVVQGNVEQVSPHLAVNVAMAHFCTGRYDEARRWATVSTMSRRRREAGAAGLGHLVTAHAHLRQGEAGPASSHARRAGQAFTSVNACRLRAVADATEHHVRLEMGERSLNSDRRWKSRCHPFFESYLNYVRARHLLVHGDAEGAMRGFFETGRRLESAGLRNPVLMNWRLHLIEVFRVSGHTALHRRSQLEYLERMQAWGEKNPKSFARCAFLLGDLQEQLGVTSARKSPLDGLSLAERRVAESIREGQSNRELAKELYLSKRTVDTHLSNIYRKVGVSCRGELVEMVRRHVGMTICASDDRLVFG